MHGAAFRTVSAGDDPEYGPGHPARVWLGPVQYTVGGTNCDNRFYDKTAGS
jgi:hypothetical protein